MAGSMNKFSEMILGVILIIIGLILLPLVAWFIGTAKANVSVSAIAGLTNVLDLIAYGVAFGLVFAGVSMIYLGTKK